MVHVHFCTDRTHFYDGNWFKRNMRRGYIFGEAVISTWHNRTHTTYMLKVQDDGTARLVVNCYNGDSDTRTVHEFNMEGKLCTS